MITSSLPRYPRPEPPRLPVAPTNGRRWFQFLQLATIIAFWVGIYLVRDKARAFSEVYRRAEERAKAEEARRGIMGRWQSSQFGSVQLDLQFGRYELLRNGSVSHDGEYEWSGVRLRLWTRTASGIAGYWSLHCRDEAGELLLWDDGTWWGKDGNWFLILNVLGLEAAPNVYAKERVLRFRRVGRSP